MTKICIISGFLGAGKTTLIKKLIQEAYREEKLVLIENEFGEIGIDGGFLAEAGVQITEMNSGCICCSLVGDFEKALKQVIDKFMPDRILIEPSGVGKLSDVTKAVAGILSDTVTLDARVAVADAKKAKMYFKNFGEFYKDQIQNADCVVLSHIETMPENKIAECMALLKQENDHAVFVTTPIEQLTGKQLRDAFEHVTTLETELQALTDEEICPVCGHHHDHDEHEHHHDHDEHECHHEHHHEHDEHDHEHHHDHEEHEHHHDHEHEHDDHDHEHHHHHHHADEVFTSWGVETTHKFTREELLAALCALEQEDRYGTVLRAKGIVAGEDSWYHFDYVPGEPEIRVGAAAVTGRLCVIGAKLQEDALKALFKI